MKASNVLLDKNRIHAEVHGRAKSLYSIHLKMTLKGTALEDIMAPSDCESSSRPCPNAMLYSDCCIPISNRFPNL